MLCIQWLQRISIPIVIFVHLNPFISWIIVHHDIFTSFFLKTFPTSLSAQQSPLFNIGSFYIIHPHHFGSTRGQTPAARTKCLVQFFELHVSEISCSIRLCRVWLSNMLLTPSYQSPSDGKESYQVFFLSQFEQLLPVLSNGRYLTHHNFSWLLEWLIFKSAPIQHHPERREKFTLLLWAVQAILGFFTPSMCQVRHVRSAPCHPKIWTPCAK